MVVVLDEEPPVVHDELEVFGVEEREHLEHQLTRAHLRERGVVAHRVERQFDRFAR